MSIIIDAMTREAVLNNTLGINPIALIAILLLVFLLGWKEKLRFLNPETNQQQMALLDVAIFPLGFVFVITIVLRIITFF